MKSTLAKLITFTAIVLAPLPSVWGITNGALDGENHPGVGLLVFDTLRPVINPETGEPERDENGDVIVAPQPTWRCTGTLISPTVMVTAGHCTSGTVGGRVLFDADVESGIPNNGYPFGGGNSIEFAEVHTHPDYIDEEFYLHDVGIVILSQPVYRDEYATLPNINELDLLKAFKRDWNAWFTAVGYGLQVSRPAGAGFLTEAARVRMVAYPTLTSINMPSSASSIADFGMILSNNAKTGGTCFGDSGGPNFLRDTNIIAGVTSFGKNPTCAGSGGVFRLDRQNVLDFINSFLAP